MQFKEALAEDNFETI